MKEQEHMRNVEMAGLATRKSKTTFEKVLHDIEDSLSHLASSDDDDDGEVMDDDGKDGELCNFSEDDEPGWVMDATSKTIHCCMERFWQKQMTLIKLTQPGLWGAASYFHKGDE